MNFFLKWLGSFSEWLESLKTREPHTYVEYMKVMLEEAEAEKLALIEEKLDLEDENADLRHDVQRLEKQLEYADQDISILERDVADLKYDLEMERNGF